MIFFTEYVKRQDMTKSQDTFATNSRDREKIFGNTEF